MHIKEFQDHVHKLYNIILLQYTHLCEPLQLLIIINQYKYFGKHLY